MKPKVDLVLNKQTFCNSYMVKMLTVHALRKGKLGSKADAQATFNTYF